MPRPTVGNLNERPLEPTFLRPWRKHRGYTLERASEMIGITHGLLSKIERQIKPYNQQILESAAKAYGCSTGDLLTVDPSVPGVAAEVEIRNLYRQATPERREIAEDVLKPKPRAH